MQEESQHTGSGHNKRRYPRLPMAMKARLRGGELENIPCIIRDFAPGGLLIKWQNEADVKFYQQKENLEGESFSLDFTVKLKNGIRKSYSIKFSVSRVLREGLGVSFIEPDDRVINILVKIADVTGRKLKKKIEDSEKTNDQTRDKLSEVELTASATLTGNNFNKGCEGLDGVEERLSQIILTFLAKLSNRLITRAKDTINEEQKYDLSRIHESLTQEIKDYRDVILQAVIGQLTGKKPQNWEKIAEEGLTGSSLTLVDEKEFEVYLLLTEIVSNAEAEHKLLLYRLTQKVSDTYNLIPDESQNPLGFSRISRTIDEFLHHVKFSFLPLNDAYKEIEVTLLPELILFYEELTEGMETTPEYKNTDIQKQKNHVSSGPGSGHHDGVVTNSNMSAQPGYTMVPSAPNAGQAVQAAVDPVLASEQISKGIDELTHNLMTLKQSLVASDPSMASSTQSLLHGEASYMHQTELLNVLDRIQHEDIQKIQSGETIGDVGSRLTPLLLESQKRLNFEEEGALEMAGDVIDFLKHEQALSPNVRKDLNRIQTVLYKQAVTKGKHFHDASNPIRNIINSLEVLDRKGAGSNPEARGVIDSLVEKILALESYEPEKFTQIANELDQLLTKQTGIFEKNIEAITEQCEREQELFSKVKRESPAKQAENQSRADQQTKGAWSIWERRAKQLKRGDTILVNDGKGNKKHLNLAWTDPQKAQFVFADDEGKEPHRMTLQELVVSFLKGNAEKVDNDGQPVFDRAVVSSLFNAYDDVKNQIIYDSVTGFMNPENFKAELEKIHKNAVRDNSEHPLFYLEVDMQACNSEQGLESTGFLGDFMNYLVQQIRLTFGDNCLTGRLDDNTVAIVSEYISKEGALILGEALFKALEDEKFQYNNQEFFIPAAIGISIINSRNEDIEKVLIIAEEACARSRERGNNQSYLIDDDLGSDTGPEPEVFNWDSWFEQFSQESAVVPLYSQTVELNGDGTAKPLVHIYPAAANDNGILSPDRFIRVSKEDRMISGFEKRVFVNMLDWLAENKKTFSLYQRCVINFSEPTINSRGIIDFIINQLSSSSVAPGKICFQIPGDVNVSGVPSIEGFVRTMTEFGCQFSFVQRAGEGLNQALLKLPVNFISIDPILINDVVNRAHRNALIKSINDIAHMLNKKTIMVEPVDEEILSQLTELKVDYLPAKIDDEKITQLNAV